MLHELILQSLQSELRTEIYKHVVEALQAKASHNDYTAPVVK